MAINLKDIPDAVKSYLNNKVTVTISGITPRTGDAVNPNESFTFRVAVANTNSANGGVALNNVLYHISVDNQAVVKLKVPPTEKGSAKDPQGNILAAGALVREMIFNPSSATFDLPAGDTDSLTVQGIAENAAGGGDTMIHARVLAHIDTNLLFPKGGTSTAAAPITVVG
jgi:hypothetical protein